jgi:hypothetical protein
MPLREALPSCRGLRARHAQKECTGSWEVPRLASRHTGHWSASGRRGVEADDVRKREVGLRHSSHEADEQGGSVRCGVGGAKGGDQGECGPTKHAPGTAPGKCVTSDGPHTTSSGRTRDLPSGTRGKSRMRQGARTDLCGGCVKKTRKRHAVRKMKVGPSEPLCRRRLQTALSCFGSKSRGGER